MSDDIEVLFALQNQFMAHARVLERELRLGGDAWVYHDAITATALALDEIRDRIARDNSDARKPEVRMDTDIDMSELTSTERAFALGYRKGLQEARAELNEEVRAIRERYQRELARLQQTVTAIRREHDYRRALAQAIEEREALRPKLLH